MKTKVVALDSICSEAKWLKELLSEIPSVSSPISLILIYYDSRAAIDFCKKKLVNAKVNRYIKLK